MTSTRATEPVAELKRFRAAERRILGWLRRLVDVADEGLHGWEVAHREEAGRGEFSSPELGAAGTSPAEADAKGGTARGSCRQQSVAAPTLTWEKIQRANAKPAGRKRRAVTAAEFDARLQSARQERLHIMADDFELAFTERA
jgi:hypothetical protein